MTFEKKFESLKKSLIKADTQKFTESFAFQVNIIDEDCGGAFYIAYVNGEYAVEPYDYKDRTALIIGSAADIAKLAKGIVAVSVEGNVSQVEMLASCFKKPVAKKSPAKKAAPAKKPATAKAETKPIAEKKPANKKAETPKTTAKPAEKVEMKTTKTPAAKSTKTAEKK